jgi:uncharacterized delta-60 repeat protein
MGPTLFLFRRTRSGEAARQPAPRFRPRVEGLEDRLTPSGGQLDPTFGSGGIVNVPNGASADAVAVQPDGKVVIAGGVARSRAGYSSISVQRLKRDGTLDTTFNGTGSVTIQTGSSDYATSVALQPDGKILVGGHALSSNGSTGESLVARLNANGTLDTTFGSKGLWLSSAAGVVKKLAVLTNATHTTVTGIVAAAQATGGFEAIKLTPAGVPDKTFGSGGFAVFANLSGYDGAHSVAVAPSGEIYLAGAVQFAGMTNIDACVAAVTPSGALDTAFGGGTGYVLAVPAGNRECQFNDVAIQTLTVNGQPVSRVIAGGYIVTPNADGSETVYGLVAAYTPGGALDTSFGSGGSFVSPNSSENWQFTSLTLEADGSIVVGGTQSYVDSSGTGQSGMLVGHLTANGTADTSFGTAGTGFVILANGRTNRVSGVAIDPTDGSILACGSLGQPVVVRLTAP